MKKPIAVKKRNRFALLCGTAMFFVAANSNPALSENFPNALSQAIENSNSLAASLAREDEADAAVSEARASFLPSLAARFSYGHKSSKTISSGSRETNSAKPYSYGVTGTLALFRGGQHVHGLKSAKFAAQAASLERFDKEQEIVLEAVDAYLGVLRDRKVVALRQENLNALIGIRNGQEVRFRLGEGTKTDIALARDRNELARAELISSQGQLRAAELTYEKITGETASYLTLPRGMNRLLPRSAAEVRERTELNNPKIKSAVARSQAALHAAKAKFGEALPSVDLKATYDWDYDTISGSQREEAGYIGVNVTVPLFAPKTYAGYRRSKAISRARDLEARDATLGVMFAADIAWAAYLTERDRLAALKSRVQAARDAEYGVNREFKGGERDVTDLLDARMRVVLAQVDYAYAEYDRHYSAYVLLATIGSLGADDVAMLQ